MARVLGKGWCNAMRIMEENHVCVSISKAPRGGGSQSIRVFGYGDGAVKVSSSGSRREGVVVVVGGGLGW